MSVDQIYDDFAEEAIIEKSEADVKIAIDFAIVDDVFSDGMKYYLQMDDIMLDIQISMSE